MQFERFQLISILWLTAILHWPFSTIATQLHCKEEKCVITSNTSKLPVTWWSPYSDEKCQNIEKITFNTPSLIELPSNILKQFPNVKVLDVQNLQLTKGITKFEADDKNQLAVLLLSSNSLPQLGENSFSEVNRLRYLDLSNNTLTSFNCESFVGLYKLNTLNVSYNRIKSVTCNFLILPKLKTLMLNDNLINSLSLENQKFSSLQHLFLQTNSFEDCTSALSSLKYLRVLNLSNNPKMSELSDFKNTALTCLFLDNVSKSDYNSQLFKSLENLELLSIKDNGITNLKVTNFSSLNNLKVFDFSRNQLSSIEYLMLNKTFPKLQQVYLIDNPWEEYHLRAMKEYFKTHKIEFEATSRRVNCELHANFTQEPATPSWMKTMTMQMILIGSNIVFFTIIIILLIILILGKTEKPTKLMLNEKTDVVESHPVKIQKSLYDMEDDSNYLYSVTEPEQAPIEEMETDDEVYVDMTQYER